MILFADPYRRLWLFLVALILAILVTGYGTLAYFQANMLKRAGESLAMAAADTADKLDRLLYERYGDSRMMARAFSPQMDNAAYLTAYLVWMQTAYAPFYRWLGVTDATGRIIAATDATTIGEDRSTARWFYAAPRDGTILVQDIKPHPEIGGRLAVSFTAAILDERGRFKGLVTSLIDVPVLAAVVKSTEHPIQASLELSRQLDYVFIAQNGDVLVSIPEDGSPRDLRDLPAIQQLMATPTPGYSSEPFFGPPMPMVTGYAPTHGYGAFQGMGWRVLIRVPEKEVLTPILKMAGILSLAASGVLIPVFAALFWTARHLKASDLQLRSQKNRLGALAAQLSRTEEQERKRLATDLHDNLAQLLALMKIKLKAAPTTGEPVFQDIKEYVNQALTYIRTLLSELSPPLLGDKNDLHAAIAWVVKKMERHGLQVAVHDDGAPKHMSEELLTVAYQAIQELLFNVLKHARTKEASLFLSRVGEELEAAVVDHGLGFDTARQFAPSREGGFGLLNIRERVELLGGRLDLTSCHGSGTRATLHLPLRIEKTLNQPIELATHANGRLNGLRHDQAAASEPVRIVLVDDHQMVREGLRSIIEEHSDLAVVAEASDGQQAIEATRRLRPDIILMDINMPKMNGVEATRHILTEDPHMTVIGLSMQDDTKIIGAMRQAGAIGYMSKGEAGEKLVDAIRAAWKEKQTSRFTH